MGIKLERSQALRDWYTLTMSTGEDIVTYGRRYLGLPLITWLEILLDQ